MTAYGELLKDLRWGVRRRQILELDNYICQDCGIDGRYKDEVTGEIDYCEMHVHHKIYKKNTMPWEYADDELLTLCYRCHILLHSAEKRKIYIKEMKEIGITWDYEADYVPIGDMLPKNIEQLKKFVLLMGKRNG